MLTVPHTEIGRRIYLVEKLHAVEYALRAIRARLGSEWKALPLADRALLQNILGEVWVASKGESWDAIPFNRLTAADLSRILDVGRSIREKRVPEQEGTAKIIRILTGTL